MVGFVRKEMEYMQALCIYNTCIKCYSLVKILPNSKIQGQFATVKQYNNKPVLHHMRIRGKCECGNTIRRVFIIFGILIFRSEAPL